MGNSKLISVQVNPLVFSEIDEPFACLLGAPLSHEAVVRYLCPEVPADLDKLATRYRTISQEKGLFAPPAEARILWRLIWPLRHVKASYMVGNYLGAIALCGMVAEMVAILLFEISPPARIPAEVKKFEGTSQVKRVESLHKAGVVDAGLVKLFDTVRLKRNEYLHALSKDSGNVEVDARELFLAAATIVQSALGIKVMEGGTLGLAQNLVIYLEKKGLMGPGCCGDDKAL